MEFVLNRVRHSLDASTVRSALRGRAPDEVREHWVDVAGVRWPPKQALAFATGIDRSEFTSHRALGLLERLGFHTSPWGAGRRTSGAGLTTVPRPTDVSSVDPVTPRGAATVSAAATIVLVGCSGSKAAEPARAAELFTGAGFRKARDLAIRSGRPWYVISAKFGLLHPDEVIAPYDVYLPKQSPRYRSAWAYWVVAQLGERHPLHDAVIEAHAGSAYCDPLIGPLAEVGARLTQPLAGLGLGQRLAWYGAAETPEQPISTTSPIPDVAWLLDERNAVSPADFLAAGRVSSDQPGLYTWWTDAEGAHALSVGLGHRIAPGLIYAGRAGGVRPNGASSTNTIWGRLATMHLGGNREFSTFRLTLTACLSRPDELISEADLTAWMHEHLRVAALPLPAGAVTGGEAHLLELTDAPLNLQDVASTPPRIALKRLRASVRSR